MNFYSTFCKAQEEWFVRNQVCCDINIRQGNSNCKWQINMIPWMQAALKVNMRLLLLAQEVLLEDLEDLRRPWFEKIYRPKWLLMSGAIFISDDLVPSSSAQLQLMMSQNLGPDAELNISEFCLKKIPQPARARCCLDNCVRADRSPLSCRQLNRWLTWKKQCISWLHFSKSCKISSKI